MWASSERANQLKKPKGGELLSGTARIGGRTSKRPLQHFMSMDMVRTGNCFHWLNLCVLISYGAISQDFLVDHSAGLGRSARVYKQLIAAEEVQALQLMSATDGSSIPFCFQLNRLLAEILVSCAKDIDSPRVLHFRSKTQQKILKEFYRVVKEATNLMRLCCNEESWLMTAFCMVDSREAFSLRCSELLWFKTVVGSYENVQDVHWKSRLETAFREDNLNLQKNVKEVNQDTSTKEFHLAWNLSRRLEAAQATTKPLAQDDVLYLNLEGLHVQEDKPLGKGATASIYRASWRGEVFAVKKFLVSNSELAAREASIATEVHHPNVVPMFGRLQGYEGTDELLMELMSSSLWSYVQASNSTWFSWLKISPFQPLVAVDMLLQIAEAMRYLHEKNIAHLDLKAENILVNYISDSYLAQEGYVNLKLVDFGCSKNTVKSSTQLYESYVGTTLYRAPEIRTGVYSRTVDVYGFAIVSYQIMTGKEPFPKPRNYREFNEKVRKGHRPKWRLIDPYPSSLKTLIEECWSGDADKRPGFATICNRLQRIKGFLITGSYDGVEELPVHEESMDPASEGGLEEDMLQPDAFFILSQNAAQRVFHLNSAWDEHPSSSMDVSSLSKTSHLNKMQCDLLVQYLRNSMDEVKKQIHSNPKSASVMTLTEYYRIVIACEKLILQCCNENWQRAAIWVMDCKAAFLLRISELLWCTAIITKTMWQDAAFTERIGEISSRLSDYAEKDHSLLKNMLDDESKVDSRHSGDLIKYLSRRADAKGDEVVKCPPQLFSIEWDLLGKGHASVYKALMFNESVAMKVHVKDNLAISEASILAKVNHPGIVQLVGVSSYPKNHYLIMELMSGDLKDLINSRSHGGSVPPFSLHVCVDIMLQIAEAMQHVHDVGLVHRDLKPANVLFKVVADKYLSKAGFVVVKVADFGLANQNRAWESLGNLEGNVGTLSYMAPELHNKSIGFEPVQMRNSNVVDVYSFGMACYEILSGKQIFEGRNPAEVRKLVCGGERPKLPATCPKILASLIKKCWASDPNSRPDFEGACRELKKIKTMIITGSSNSTNF